MSIGGNTKAIIEIKQLGEKDEIGSRENDWKKAKSIVGWLDLMTGTTSHTIYNEKVQEATHIFMCDYKTLTGITAENARMVIGKDIYEITYIDDPMNMHEHLEICTKKVG